MTYTVRSLPRAERDFNRHLHFIANRSKPGAKAWAKAFERALSRLADNADSCPLAYEDESVDFEVREQLFKTRRGLMYRILFTIRDQTVFLMHIRGPGQDYVKPDSLAMPPE